MLELFGRDALVRLVEMRGLAPSHDNDERRARVARSYRGEIATFLADLRRVDLLELMQVNWEIGGRTYYLPRAASRNHDELLRIANVIFQDRVALELREVEEDPEPPPEDSAPIEPADPRDPLADLKLGSGWSRPRMLSRVLHVLGMEPAERLRTVRFQQAMRQLDELGVAVELDDGTALGPTDTSPGISARVRLRLREPGEQWPPTQPSSRTAPPPPVTLLPPTPSPSRPPPPISEWEFALARLHFLTCVHDVDRRFRPEWPDSFVAAAAEGLDLSAEHRRMLPLVAASLSYGTHDPLRVIAQLAPRLGRDSWISLLGQFRTLNASQADLADEIARSAERAAALEPGATRVTHVPTRPAEAVDPPAGETEVGQPRSLGALDGIFDD